MKGHLARKTARKKTRKKASTSASTTTAVRDVLTGNQCIARAALACGSRMITGYPGTPATTIVSEAAARVKASKSKALQKKVRIEWSVNEKIAFETSAAASIAGLRSLTVMKTLGLNLVTDPLTVIAYTGVNGGCVIVTADDPAQFSSQNAEDSRRIAALCKVPCIEPKDGESCFSAVREAFDTSEALKLPVIIRITPRISHALFDVTVPRKSKDCIAAFNRHARFRKDWKRYVTIASNSRILHKKLEEKQNAASVMLSKSKLNSIWGHGTIGIIACGIVQNYVSEALFEAKASESEFKVLNLSTTWPLPSELVRSFLEGVETLIVLEELEPIVETEIRSIIQQKQEGANANIRVYGKIPPGNNNNNNDNRSSVLQRTGEYDADIVKNALSNFAGISFPKELFPEEIIKGKDRTPALCAGCPHRGTFYGIKRALYKKAKGGRKRIGIIVGDRGCYNQGALPPLSAMDTCICMGASISMAAGFAQAGVKEPVVAVIGDGTFIHAGIPALVNAVCENAKIAVVILDNDTIAMTGHQPRHGTGIDLMGNHTPKISIENLVRSCGVQNVRVVDAYNVRAVEHAVRDALKSNSKPAVIISRRPCVVREKRKRGGSPERRIPRAYKIDDKKCNSCMQCLTELGCPAIETVQPSKRRGGINDGKTKIVINTKYCNGCGICAQVCTRGAIKWVVI